MKKYLEEFLDGALGMLGGYSISELFSWKHHKPVRHLPHGYVYCGDNEKFIQIDDGGMDE